MLGNLRRNGLVAQLGAHHIRIVGVEGSNPFKSTKKKDTRERVFFWSVKKAVPQCRNGSVSYLYCWHRNMGLTATTSSYSSCST